MSTEPNYIVLRLKESINNKGLVRNEEGQVMTPTAWIEDLIEEGFTKLSSQKVGATTRYSLTNPVTRVFIPFRRKIEVEYIRFLLGEGVQRL